MSNLTEAQIETFDQFAADTKEYLDGESVETKNKSVRVVNTKSFLDVWKTVSRPSKLAPVMQTQLFFAEHGRTKSKFRLRNEDGSFRTDSEGNPSFSRTHVVLYRAEVYREARKERTGLSTPETVYGITWDNVPSDMKTKIRQWYFPNGTDRKGNSLPSFVPSLLGLVLRKGKKVKKGERRHAWAGFDFVLFGHYGPEKIPTVITQISVVQKPYLASFASLMGVACPDWGQNEGVSEEMSKAACGIYQNLDLKF